MVGDKSEDVKRAVWGQGPLDADASLKGCCDTVMTEMEVRSHGGDSYSESC